MNYRATFVISFLVSILTVGHAQQSKTDLNRAKSLLDKMAYTDAILALQEIASQDPSNYEALVSLADSYRLTGKYQEAEKWYAKVVIHTRANDLDRFHYGQMLMNNGKYEEAKKWLALAEKQMPSDERARNYLNAIDDLSQFFADSVSYTLENFPGNGTGNDFSPAFFQTGIVFTSSKKAARRSDRHAWTGESFTELFYADQASDIGAFAPEIQSKLNNGPASFSSTNEMFTTVNVAAVKNTQEGIYKLNIVSSTFDGKKWLKPVSFQHNSSAYNVAHPAISHDGKRLYFSSDMPGGEGGMDLYYCDREGENWSKPVSLGSHINTPGNELFPFLREDGTLYFASNGHEGLGGLDIYSAIHQDGQWASPLPMSFPVNTPHDDFGFIIDGHGARGYFSSNRPGGKGGDDIYGFTFTPAVIEGAVLNKDTKLPITSASVTLKDKRTGETSMLQTDAAGMFMARILPCREYEIIVTHTQYKAPVDTLFKSSCTRSGKQSTQVLFGNPVLTVSVRNKHTGKMIDASIEIRDSQTDSIIATGISSDLNVSVSPCTEYIVTGKKKGMPDVKTNFKTSCITSDETVTLAMGVPPVDATLLEGAVYDQDAKKPLDSAVVVVYNTSNKAIAHVSTDPDGTFSIIGTRDIGRLVFFRNGYFSVTVVPPAEPNRKRIVAELPALKLDKIIRLEGIYYDVGKYDIRPDAARVLENLVAVMKENPSLKIEISAHTDARGNDASNLSLSDKRAKSAAAFVINKGIADDRIVGKGYGETQLKNTCGNGVKCSEKKHQENRRTEIKITGY